MDASSDRALVFVWRMKKIILRDPPSINCLSSCESRRRVKPIPADKRWKWRFSLQTSDNQDSFNVTCRRRPRRRPRLRPRRRPWRRPQRRPRQRPRYNHLDTVSGLLVIGKNLAIRYGGYNTIYCDILQWPPTFSGTKDRSASRGRYSGPVVLWIVKFSK